MTFLLVRSYRIFSNYIEMFFSVETRPDESFFFKLDFKSKEKYDIR